MKSVTPGHPKGSLRRASLGCKQQAECGRLPLRNPKNSIAFPHTPKVLDNNAGKVVQIVNVHAKWLKRRVGRRNLPLRHYMQQGGEL